MIERIEAMARQMPPGVFVEFGVFRGGTARTLANVAEEQERELHLFDTFTGIPFKGPRDVHSVSDFGATSEKEVRELIPTAIFHVGIFPTTMPDKLGRIAFCHIDADQEQSYRDAIRLFSPLMVKGGVMWFDDYGCFGGVTAAVDEAFGDRIVKDNANKPHVVF
jgi:predicted O-methyltransferase YrrM